MGRVEFVTRVENLLAATDSELDRDIELLFYKRYSENEAAEFMRRRLGGINVSRY